MAGGALRGDSASEVGVMVEAIVAEAAGATFTLGAVAPPERGTSSPTAGAPAGADPGASHSPARIAPSNR